MNGRHLRASRAALEVDPVDFFGAGSSSSESESVLRLRLARRSRARSASISSIRSDRLTNFFANFLYSLAGTASSSRPSSSSITSSGTRLGSFARASAPSPPPAAANAKRLRRTAGGVGTALGLGALVGVAKPIARRKRRPTMARCFSSSSPHPISFAVPGSSTYSLMSSIHASAFTL